jgi:hypothetical protein
MAYFTSAQAIETVNATNIADLKKMMGLSPLNSSKQSKRVFKTGNQSQVSRLETMIRDNAIPQTIIDMIIEMNTPTATKTAAKNTKTTEVKRVNLNDYMGSNPTTDDGKDYEYNRTVALAERVIDYTFCQPEAAEKLAVNVFNLNDDRSDWLSITEILASLDNGFFLSDVSFGRLKGAISKRLANHFTEVGQYGFIPDIWNRYGVKFSESMIDRTGKVNRFHPTMVPEILRLIGIAAKFVYDANPSHPAFKGKVWIGFDELVEKYVNYPEYAATFKTAKGETLPEFNGCYVPQIGLVTDMEGLQAIIGRRLKGH